MMSVVLTAAILRRHGRGVDPLDGPAAAVLAVGRAARRGAIGAALLRPLRRPLSLVLLLWLLVHVLLLVLDLLGSFVHRRCHHGKLFSPNSARIGRS